MTSIMSTEAGQHVDSEKHTEMPCRALIHVLEAEANLQPTQTLVSGRLYDEMTADLVDVFFSPISRLKTGAAHQPIKASVR